MKKKCRMGKRSEVYNKAALVTADCSPTVPISLSKDRSLAQIDGVGWAADILLQFTLWLQIGTSKGGLLQTGMAPRTTVTQQEEVIEEEPHQGSR